MRERPLDNGKVCSLLRGLPVRLKMYSLEHERQSGLTHL